MTGACRDCLIFLAVDILRLWWLAWGPFWGALKGNQKEYYHCGDPLILTHAQITSGALELGTRDGGPLIMYHALLRIQESPLQKGLGLASVSFLLLGLHLIVQALLEEPIS